MTANAANGLAITRQIWHNQPQKHPIHLVILNLMPTKVTTELQFLKCFNDLKQDVTLTFLYPQSHHFKNSSLDELEEYYFNLHQVSNQDFDGLIITGAPVEKLAFTQVDYWLEFNRLITWATHHVREALFECWAAQASLFVDFKIPKKQLRNKLFGIFTATNINPHSRLTQNFAIKKHIKMPQSRYSTSILDQHHLPGDLKVIIDSQEAGPMILRSVSHHHTYITGHPEYDDDTLAQEYYRDQQKQITINPPQHYFSDQTIKQVDYSWQATSHLIYQNWLNIIEHATD